MLILTVALASLAAATRYDRLYRGMYLVLAAMAATASFTLPLSPDNQAAAATGGVMLLAIALVTLTQGTSK